MKKYVIALDAGTTSSPVSYTHLDVYKRQPVRIVRDDRFQSNVAGLYPCGEGAGYAGGITSAAVDGLRVAEAIVAARLSEAEAPAFRNEDVYKRQTPSCASG